MSFIEIIASSPIGKMDAAEDTAANLMRPANEKPEVAHRSKPLAHMLRQMSSCAEPAMKSVADLLRIDRYLASAISLAWNFSISPRLS